MSDWFSDLRLSLRQLAKSPGFTLAAVLCLALGIGANSAVFSFALSILSEPPLVKEPQRLVRLFTRWEGGIPYGSFSYPDYLDLRQRENLFTALAVESPRPLHLGGDGRSERLWGAVVSANYFELLGVEPALGRAFLPEEGEAPGSAAVAVLSHGLWQRRFAGDPEVIGRSMVLNGHPFTIVGVAPAAFRGPNVGFAPELWVPVTMAGVIWPGGGSLDGRGNHWLAFTIGRLAPGVTPEQAAAALRPEMERLAREYPDTNTGKGVVVLAEAQGNLHPVVRGSFVGFLALMFGVVGFVLLLACASVAGLLVARASARRREIAVRLALGAGRGRLVRQLLTESLVLSLLAGGAGLVLAAWLVQVVAAVPPPVDFPLDLGAGVDGRVLAFTFLAALATGVLFGLTPALQSSRPELVPALKEGPEGGRGAAGRLRKALVVGQVALSLVLLVGAVLTLESLGNARRIDLGFNPEHQLIASMDVGLQGYDRERGEAFFSTLARQVRSLPGVTSAGYAEIIPLTLNNQQTSVRPQGFEVPAGQSPPSIDFNLVGPGYFQAMAIPLLRGRGFAQADGEESARVLVVNQAFARRFWPGEDPLGKRVTTLSGEHEVVGLVPDGKYFSLGEEPKPYFYASIDRYYSADRTLHLRTAGDPAALAAGVRGEVAALDPNLPLYNLKPMEQQLSFVQLPSRLAAWVAGAFAVLALLLAAVGLYGVIAYWVSQGRHEIGIRLALGADRRDVVRLVVWRGLSLALVGAGIGLAGGYAVARLASGLLYGVSPGDLRLYAAATAALLAAALLASWLPARRAVRLDPVEALRAE